MLRLVIGHGFGHLFVWVIVDHWLEFHWLLINLQLISNAINKNNIFLKKVNLKNNKFSLCNQDLCWKLCQSIRVCLWCATSSHRKKWNGFYFAATRQSRRRWLRAPRRKPSKIRRPRGSLSRRSTTKRICSTNAGRRCCDVSSTRSIGKRWLWNVSKGACVQLCVNYGWFLRPNNWCSSKLQRRLSLEPFFDVESGHFDFVPGLKHGINRLAGVWAMLQEPEKGGDIVFPYGNEKANCERKKKIDFFSKKKKGMNENGEPRMPLTFDWQHHRAAVCGSNDKPGTGGLRINLNAGDVVLWFDFSKIFFLLLFH